MGYHCEVCVYRVRVEGEGVQRRKSRYRKGKEKGIVGGEEREGEGGRVAGCLRLQ